MLSEDIILKIIDGEEIAPEEVGEQEKEEAVREAVPSLPPTVTRPIRTFQPSTRVSSTGREFTYGKDINNFLDNGQ